MTNRPGIQVKATVDGRFIELAGADSSISDGLVFNRLLVSTDAVISEVVLSDRVAAMSPLTPPTIDSGMMLSLPTASAPSSLLPQPLVRFGRP